SRPDGLAIRALAESRAVLPSDGGQAAMRTTAGRALALSALILAWPAVGRAEKTDVLVLRNGDRITGEIKGLNRGKLDYSTDDAGRLAVEWVKVTRISSPHSFEVEHGSGAKYFGRLAVTDRDGLLYVVGSRVDSLTIPSVVQISPLDAGFFQ